MCIATLSYSVSSIIKKKNYYDWKVYGITAGALVLLMVFIGYFNQHFSYYARRFDDALYTQLVHTKDYGNKKNLKKKIASKYDREAFSSKIGADVDTDYDSFYLSANDLVDGIEIDQKLTTAYVHLLSFLIPDENENQKIGLKKRVVASIYDCENCNESSITTGFKSLEVSTRNTNENDWVILNSVFEKQTTSSDLINSEVEINVTNTNRNAGQFQFIFELPQNAVVNGMSVKNAATGGVWVNAQLVPESVAEIVYAEEIRSNSPRPRDPAVLNELITDTYELKVYPVPANSDYSVKINYVASSDSKVGLVSDGVDVQKEVVQNPEELSDSYFIEDDGSVTAVLDLEDFSNVSVVNPVVLVLDTTFSMKSALEQDGVIYELKNIYSYLTSAGIEPMVYSQDNGISKLSEKDLEDFNSFQGYSNRKIALSELFAEEDLKDQRFHLIYITDDSADVEFDDYEYENISRSSIKGIEISDSSEILSMNVIQLGNNANYAFDGVFREFLYNNDANVINIETTDLFDDDFENDVLAVVSENVLMNDFASQSEASAKLLVGQSEPEVFNVRYLTDRRLIISADCKEYQNIGGEDEMSLLLEGTILGEWSLFTDETAWDESVSDLLSFQITRDMKSGLNYLSNDNARNLLGNGMFVIGQKENILAPYTSFIYVETEAQQQRIDELIAAGDNFDSEFNSSDLGYFMPMASTGQETVWLVMMLGVLFVGRMAVVLIKQKR